MRRRTDRVLALLVTGATAALLAAWWGLSSQPSDGAAPARVTARAPSEASPDFGPASVEPGSASSEERGELRVARVVPWAVSTDATRREAEVIGTDETRLTTITLQLTVLGETDEQPVSGVEARLVGPTSRDGREPLVLKNRGNEYGVVRLDVPMRERTEWTLHLRRPECSWTIPSTIRLDPSAGFVEKRAFVPAGSARLELRVTDSDNRPLAAPWSASLEISPSLGAVLLDDPRRRRTFRPEVLHSRIQLECASDAADANGVVHLENLPPWPAWIRFSHSIDFVLLTVELRDGGTTEKAWKWEGPDPRRALRVDFGFGADFELGGAPLRARLHAPDGRIHEPVESLSKLRSLSFANLGPGAHVLEADDPRFEPMRVEGLRAGDAPRRVTPVGAAEVVLDVRDARNGGLLTNWSAVIGESDAIDFIHGRPLLHVTEPIVRLATGSYIASV